MILASISGGTGLMFLGIVLGLCAIVLMARPWRPRW